MEVGKVSFTFLPLLSLLLPALLLSLLPLSFLLFPPLPLSLLSFLPPFFPPLPPLPHQSLLLEGGCGSIKHKHWFDVIVEELTNPVEEYQEVGVGEGIPLCIPRPLHCLVQPDTHIWCVCVCEEKWGEGGRGWEEDTHNQSLLQVHREGL